MSRTPHPHTAAALRQAMDAALAAALEGPRGANPLVGASVLSAGGTLVTARHDGAGTPHAEVAALGAARSAGIDLSTATVCVTLEPCDHHGRTGPCSRMLLDAGVPEVIVACPDPNPTAAGGIGRLRAAGIRVRTGVRAAEAAALNARWLRAVGQARPYVTLKLAQSLDGRIAAADGTSQWITHASSRERVHRLRASVDAVMVGTGTALADDPRLSARAGSRAAASTGAVLTPRPVPVVMGTRDLDRHSHLARNPHTVHLRTRDPLTGLQELRRHGIGHVLVEGGAGLAASLIRADLVDGLEVHIAPILLGDGLPALSELGVTTLAEASRWEPDPAADWDIVASASPERADTILRLVPAPSRARPNMGDRRTTDAAAGSDPAASHHTDPRKD